MISAKAVAKIDGLSKMPSAAAPRCCAAARNSDGGGFFYPPTVLTDVPADAEMVHEEIFGPVAPITRFDTEDEVIARANDTEYGLAAYVFTKDIGRGMRVSRRIEAGMVGAEPRAGLGPGGALRRSEAERTGSRGWLARRIGIFGAPVRCGNALARDVARGLHGDKFSVRCEKLNPERGG